MSKKEDTHYVVLVRQKILSTPGMTTQKHTYAISYTTTGMAPSTIFIPEEKWNEKFEKDTILKDIEARRKVAGPVVSG